MFVYIDGDKLDVLLSRLHPSIYQASVCIAYLVYLPVALSTAAPNTVDIIQKRALLARKQLFEFFFISE